MITVRKSGRIGQALVASHILRRCGINFMVKRILQRNMIVFLSTQQHADTNT